MCPRHYKFHTHFCMIYICHFMLSIYCSHTPMISQVYWPYILIHFCILLSHRCRLILPISLILLLPTDNHSQSSISYIFSYISYIPAISDANRTHLHMLGIYLNLCQYIVGILGHCIYYIFHWKV